MTGTSRPSEQPAAPLTVTQRRLLNVARRLHDTGRPRFYLDDLVDEVMENGVPQSSARRAQLRLHVGHLILNGRLHAYIPPKSRADVPRRFSPGFAASLLAGEPEALASIAAHGWVKLRLPRPNAPTGEDDE